MTKQELIDKIKDIEWEDFEIKSCKSKLSSNVWETVSAFSNTAGGWLIFGVEFKGEKYDFIGVDKPEELEQNFTTVLRGEKFNRIIETQSKKYKFNKATVLAFYIPQKTPKERPVYFGNNQFNTFIRSGSGDQRATKEEIDAMYRNSSFDQKDSEILNWGVEAIDSETLERYRNYFQSANPGHHLLQYSKKEFLQKLRVLEGNKITVGGLLVFGKDEYIARNNSSYKIDYIEIDGTSYTNASNRYKYRLTSEENLFKTFFNTYPRLIMNIDIPFELTSDGLRNDDQVHVQALREALVNLIIHSDYFSKGSPRIRVFKDRFEFFNHGGLPKNLDYILKQDFSLQRNPIVAKCFRYLKLAENLGSGFHKMIDGWNSFYNIIPIIEGDFDYYSITFPFVNKWNENSSNSEQMTERENEKRNEKQYKNPLQQEVPSDKGNEYYSRESRRRWILKEIRKRGFLKRIHINEYFGVTKKQAITDLTGLIKANLIIKTGTGSTTRYILVEKLKD